MTSPKLRTLIILAVVVLSIVLGMLISQVYLSTRGPFYLGAANAEANAGLSPSHSLSPFAVTSPSHSLSQFAVLSAATRVPARPYLTPTPTPRRPYRAPLTRGCRWQSVPCPYRTACTAWRLICNR